MITFHPKRGLYQLSPTARKILEISAPIIAAGGNVSTDLLATRLGLSTNQIVGFCDRLKARGFIDWVPVRGKSHAALMMSEEELRGVEEGAVAMIDAGERLTRDGLAAWLGISAHALHRRLARRKELKMSRIEFDRKPHGGRIGTGIPDRDEAWEIELAICRERVRRRLDDRRGSEPVDGSDELDDPPFGVAPRSAGIRYPDADRVSYEGRDPVQSRRLRGMGG